MAAAASGHDASPLAGVFGITSERPGVPPGRSLRYWFS